MLYVSLRAITCRVIFRICHIYIINYLLLICFLAAAHAAGVVVEAERKAATLEATPVGDKASIENVRLAVTRTYIHSRLEHARARRHAGTQKRRHAGTHALTHARAHARMQARTQAHTQARSHAHTHIRTHVYTYVCIYIDMYICICVYTHIYIYMYIYIHIHIDFYICIHKYIYIYI